MSPLGGWRRGGLAAGLGVAVAGAIAPVHPADLPLSFAASSTMLSRDAQPQPPRLRHGVSSAGNYHLVLTLGSGDRQLHTVASLYETLGDRCQQRWSQPLPHSYGPRLGLVTDSGTVVLLDEWINVASPYAVVVLDREGAIATQHSFDAVVQAVGQSRAAVVDQAAQGFWIGGDPALSAADSQLTIPTAGGHLHLRLPTGDLTFESGGG